MKLKDCFDKGLLRKRRPDELKSQRGLELARADLDRAAKLIKSNFYMESRILSYTGMFQAARALLFKNGIFERSHVCVVEYLREKYTKQHILAANFVNWLDTLRVDRHESLYGLEILDITREEAEDSYNKAMKFVDEIENILNNK